MSALVGDRGHGAVAAVRWPQVPGPVQAMLVTVRGCRCRNPVTSHNLGLLTNQGHRGCPAENPDAYAGRADTGWQQPSLSGTIFCMAGTDLRWYGRK